MNILTIIITLLAIAAILAMIYIYYYNRLQDFQLKINEAESILDENLRKKYDKVLELQKKVLKVAKVNDEEFKELENIKKEDISNFDLDRKVIEIFNKLDTIISDYEKLRNKKEINDIVNEIKRLDEKIESAKLYYNKYVTLTNLMIRKFPSNLIAKIHKIEIRNYFDNKDLNDDVINDFKL